MSQSIRILSNDKNIKKTFIQTLKDLGIRTNTKGDNQTLIAYCQNTKEARNAFSFLKKSKNITKALFIFPANVKGKPPPTLLSELAHLKIEKGIVVKTIFVGDIATKIPYTNPQSVLLLISPEQLVKESLAELFSFGNSRLILAAKLPASALPANMLSENVEPALYDLQGLTIKELELDLKSIQFAHIAHMPRKKTHKSSKKPFVMASFILFWLITLPFFLLFLSAGTLALAFTQIKKGETPYTLVLLSQKTASLAKTGLTPLPGNFAKIAGLVESSAKTTEDFFVIANTSSEILSGVMGENDYNLNGLASDLYLELDKLYKESSFLEANVKSYPKSLMSQVPQIENISRYRADLLLARDSLPALPALLGADSPQTYLVLFQNNMELRPTGGFIGSFALATFENGKLIDFPVYDVYSADGQIKGYIKAPDPIVNYLGEPSWFLRDSNWDPDFSVSAARAEWFLDKSINRQVDGVVAIDLDLLKNLLAVTGPIKLNDFNDQITFDNFYQKIQYQVEDNFFPGSRKKAAYLSALSTTLLEALKTTTPNQKTETVKEVLASLDQKSIQVYLHNSQAQSAVSVLGWSGEAQPSASCEGNCHNLWLGLVEANLGVNKANYFIRRKSQLTVNLKPTSIENTLTVTFTNSGNKQNTPENHYKNYLRLLLAESISFDTAYTLKGTKKIEQAYDLIQVDGRTEVGVLVDIAPSTEKTITFRWSEKAALNPSRKGSLNLFWRKQPGVEETPTTIFVIPDPVFGLTKESSLRYNTNLSVDYNLKIDW